MADIMGSNGKSRYSLLSNIDIRITCPPPFKLFISFHVWIVAEEDGVLSFATNQQYVLDLSDVIIVIF